jgi:aerobic carbon-monoxide dehydrogenase large subunit
MQDDARPKFIGSRVQRLEDPRLLTGAGGFVDDIQLAHTLHVALVRSDHAHARILSVDVDAAGALPGVIGIYTADDFSASPLHATSRMKGYQSTGITALAEGKVRFVGEAIAAVVAESRYIAEDAAGLITVGYAPLPDLVDSRIAAASDVLLHEHHESNILVSRKFARGDVAEAFANAAIRVKDSFRFHRKTPLAIENRSYLADFNKGKQALTLYSSTQVPGVIRDALAEVLAMPGHSVRVVAPDVGGGFGGKASLYPEEILVSLLSRKLGQPVKWTSDRLEDLLTTSQAFDEAIDAELAVDKDGHLLGLKAEILGDVGAYSIYPWTAALEPMQVAGFLPGPYQLANYQAEVVAVTTNKTPAGPYRGVGRPAAAFVLERLIDMAAQRLDLDPVEMRRRNLVQPDQFPYRTGSGIVWDQSGFIECLELACKGVNYPALQAERSVARQAGRWFGVGVASYAELTGIGSRMSAAPGMPINTGTETATVEVDASGAVRATFGVASHGQGLETTLAQIVADELSVPVDSVQVIHGDSAAVTHSTGTYASRSAVLAGGAAHLSGQAVRDKVLEAAAFMLEADTDDLDIEDGIISERGTNKTLSLAEVGRAVYSEMGRFPLEMRAELDLRATKFYDPEFGTTTSATHIAAVEIDPETFIVTVKRFLVAEDCGRLINPMIVDGQVHGGIVQGIGAALYEEVVHDQNGQALSASLVDYVAPSAAETPKLEVLHLDTAALGTLGGYRGMGEGGTIGAPAAIANAITDALSHLNINISELPATPERIYRLVTQAIEGDT